MPEIDFFDFSTLHYDIDLATRKEHIAEVKRIRCEALVGRYGFDEKELIEKGYLWNEDDDRSFIYLIRHRETDRYVGTVRICFVNDKTPRTLPLQHEFQVDRAEAYLSSLPCGEISRFALAQTLPTHSHISLLTLRHLLTTLLMTATRLNMIVYPYRSILAIMEPMLYRILRRQGVVFDPIGEPIEFYGKRTPYAVDRQRLLRSTEAKLGPLTRFYLERLCHDPSDFVSFVSRHPYLDTASIPIERLCRSLNASRNTYEISYLSPDTTLHTSTARRPS